MRKLAPLGVLVLALACLAIGAAPAHADGAATITAELDNYDPGETVVLHAAGFVAGENVTVTALGATNGTALAANATADDQGAFTVSLVLPANVYEGDYAVNASGDQGTSASGAFADGPSSLTFVDGSGNSLNGTTVYLVAGSPQPFTVSVYLTNKAGDAFIAGVPIEFTQSRPAGGWSPACAVSDPTGHAYSAFTANGAITGQLFALQAKVHTKSDCSDGGGNPTATMNGIVASPTTLTVAPSSATYGGTTTLSATLTDASGAVSGQTISFTLFGSGVGSATTDASGVASLSGVSITGMNAGSYAISASFAGTSSELASTGTGSLTITKAPSTATIDTGYSGAYTGTAHPVTATVTGAGGLSQALTVTYSCGSAPIHVADTPCTASAQYAGDDNHDASNLVTTTITITAASPSVTITGGTFIYDGASHPATGTALGVDGVTAVAGTFSFTYAGGTSAPVDTGTYAVNGTFTSADTDYTGGSGTASITINKAPSTATILPGYNGVFDGNAHPTTATVTGAGGLSGSVLVTYSCGSAPIHVAETPCTASATYAGDPNHDPSNTATTTITITPAAPALTVGGTAQYDGAPHDATALATGVGGTTVSGSFTFSYTPGGTAPINAGSYLVTATFTSTNTDYSGGSISGTFTITKAPSTATINAGYSGAYTGTAHPVTATVTGAGGLGQSLTVVYTPGGAMPPTTAGTYTASAQYAGDANHLASNVASTTITITQAGGATIVQTGLASFTTSGVGVTTATVTSSATVTTPFANVADARVTFVYDTSPTTPIPGCGDLSVGAVSGMVGSASCQWTGQAPNTSGGGSYTVIALVGFGGSWTGNSDDLIVNINQPLTTSFITGGGYLNLANAAGPDKGTGKSNFGFNVKYNKSGTNLQGNVNVIVRSGDTVYQFKSNALNQLTTDPTLKKANFTGKANLQTWNVNDPTNIESLGGNLTMQLTMQDVADPGAGKDMLSIAVWDSNGALLFSSNWNGTTTVQQTLGGGNLQVH